MKLNSVFFYAIRFGAPKTVVCTQNADFCDEVRCEFIPINSSIEGSEIVVQWWVWFIFQVTKLLCERWSIVQKVSRLDQPQLNPLHDCTSPLLKEAIVQMVTEKQDEWDDFLDPVLFLFRTSTNPTTKFTPYSLMFNRKANLPNEVRFHLSGEKILTVLFVSAYQFYFLPSRLH